jgi:hypothetical protein
VFVNEPQAGAAISVGYVGVTPDDGDAERLDWPDIRNGSTLGVRHHRMLVAAVDHARLRLDHEPIAFRMLPPRFTPAELQAVYEIMLERRLHKASFRRALQAARLVQPTSEWRARVGADPRNCTGSPGVAAASAPGRSASTCGSRNLDRHAAYDRMLFRRRDVGVTGPHEIRGQARVA